MLTWMTWCGQRSLCQIASSTCASMKYPVEMPPQYELMELDIPEGMPELIDILMPEHTVC